MIRCYLGMFIVLLYLLKIKINIKSYIKCETLLDLSKRIIIFKKIIFKINILKKFITSNLK